ncbi:interleukin-1 receptor accessory protein-like isoform X3 [Carcharodon carcharias]|uniref:interleukin-1 receptor accessory protein-like isoform X3 n=1 Tax=Carcharodon carcharias TaxID=13397 RepID=UPI001B7EF8E0|nr:interleukin-1 receptor accessory protein-like isoform X3 [Carcharodon carcharias]XP_041038738.1 interleukin-1 receptor accessory protein-like isoform X3 [Carcharodon carcharias]XP_041038739.1 interleukin-1 receptor accessory protein-like isoform X3 [Carcharodon carcharias]XP_041038740.1 interleukin-1 receptor accessory protein-like isoform X3 [Carcharodon carcharias]
MISCYQRMPWSLSVLMLWILACIAATETHSESGQCVDWGVDNINTVKAYNGEPAKISCPLFLTYIKFNYSMAHGSGLTLVWYKTRQNEDLEEPIDFHQAENRIVQMEDVLWFWPVLANDSGNYTCMLRNTTDCLKVAIPLLVIQKGRNSCNSSKEMVFPVELILGETRNLICPNTAEFSNSSINSTVAWYMDLSEDLNKDQCQGCRRVGKDMDTVKEIENKLLFFVVREYHEKEYTCIVTTTRRDQQYNLTRTVAVSICASQHDLKPPILVQPKADQQIEVEYDQEVDLTCRMFFHCIQDSRTILWWSVDGRNAQELAPTIKIFQSVELSNLKDKTITSTLSIKSVTPSDLQRNYTCFGQNRKGLSSVQVTLLKKAPSYAIELGCALGVMLLILVISIFVYHFWWMEVILLYRLYFGTDETIGDGKEFDVYMSYARNAEEEEFVLTTLRSVLENEYGYRVCIYDRDSLPGGIITDETLACIWKSRRLVVVLSPNYLVNGTQALLELKAGTECMASTGQIRVILVEFIPVRKVSHVAELRRLKAVMATIKWEGEKSQDLRSRFWKRLRVALPTKRKTQTSERKSERLTYRKLDLLVPEGNLLNPPLSENCFIASKCLHTYDERAINTPTVSENSTTEEAESSTLC